MATQCNGQKFLFHSLDSREVVAQFDGGKITSDAGGLLLRETELVTGITGRFVASGVRRGSSLADVI